MAIADLFSRLSGVLGAIACRRPALGPEAARRVAMTLRCRDTDPIPKVPRAGQVIDRDGLKVQVMHDGTLVAAGGYHGDWMTEIIRGLKGHHEPQEELAFHHLLARCRPGTVIVEVGAFWAYYTTWYLGAVAGSTAVCVEPDANNMACGERNLALNGRSARWVNACVGRDHAAVTTIRRESDGATVSVPCHTLDSLLAMVGRGPIEMLHVDCQGAELPFLQSLGRAVEEGLLRFVVVSTHHASISGSNTTHQDCLRQLQALGATILCEHTVEESFSGDGLVVASFLPADAGIDLPAVSRSEPRKSLFGADGAGPGGMIAGRSLGEHGASEERHPTSAPSGIPRMESARFTSYAQNLEDILLWRALRHVRCGCYIDVGAHDPRRESVSRGFYERGWRGVHFEPNPVFAEKIRQDRPDEIVHEVALSDEPGTLRFAVTTASGLSTGAVAYAEVYRRSGQVAEERDVRTTTLEEACRPLVGRDVHWLKIDVEGMEGQVLRGWDPKTLRPWIIVVEATRPGSTTPAHESWEQLLLDADYRFVFFDGLNRFYVAAERPELAAAFSAPVNIHDLAGGCEIADTSPFVAGAVGRRDAVIARMQASRSWRWTRPLRWLVSLASEAGGRDDP